MSGSDAVGEREHEKRLGYGTAAIAAVAALIGSLVGGGFTLWGAHQQISAQADQQEDAFLRSERNAAYALMLRTNTDLLLWESSHYQSVIYHDGIYPEVAVDRYWNRIGALQNRMQRALTQVHLVGSQDVSTVATWLSRDHVLQTGTIGDMVEVNYLSERDSAGRGWNAGLRRLAKDSNAFLKVVRRDLGSDAD